MERQHHPPGRLNAVGGGRRAGSVRANPIDKFELGIRKLIEELMIERMAENDQIVTRYMADRDFQGSAFPILAREIFDAVRAAAAQTASEPPLPARG
jgi:hypothetical protein